MRKLIVTAVMGVALGACATQPKASEGTTIYVDPETGELTAGEETDPETAAILGMLSDALNGKTLEPDLEDDEIFKVDDNDNYTHIQSGFICPKEWSRFKRNDVTIYNRKGFDVGCNYVDGDGGVVTFYAYAYSDRQPLQVELDDVIENIVKVRNPVHQDSEIVSKAPPQKNRFGYLGDAITFKIADGILIKSGLLLADMGHWRIKVRMTYPEASSEAIEQFAVTGLQGQWDRILRHLSENTTDEPVHTLPMPGNEIEA